MRTCLLAVCLPWLCCAAAQTTTPVTPTAPVIPPPTVTVGTATADFSVSVEPPPVLLQRGGRVTLTAIVASIGGFATPVTLSVQGTLPQGLVVTFTPETVTPVQAKPLWGATISSALLIDTSTVPYFYSRVRPPAQVRQREGSPVAAASALCVTGLLLVGMRRRWRIGVLLAEVAVCALPVLQGCGAGIYPNQADAGVYLLNVQATAATGQTHVVPLLLRVSK